MASNDSLYNVVKFPLLKVPNEAFGNFFELRVRSQILFRVFERRFVQLQWSVRFRQVLCILQFPFFRFSLQVFEHGGHSGDFQEQVSFLLFRAGSFAGIFKNGF